MSQAALVPKLRFSEFSDDWEEKRFVDITTKISDGIHSTPNYDEGGTYSFVNGNNLVNGVIKINSQTKKVDENEYTTHQRPLGSNTILISINGTIGNLALYNNEKVVLGKSACYLNINEKDTDKLYVFNLLRTCKIKRFFNSELTGSTIKNLSLTTIKNTKLNLPTKPEQQKIAAFLTAVDNKIEQLSKKQALLGEYKKGLMQQIFSQAIRFKADDGSDFPDWKENKVDEFMEVTRGQVLAVPEMRQVESEIFKYPVYSSQTKNNGLTGYYTDYLFEDCITWTTDGANAGDVNYRAGKFYCTNVCGVLRSKKGYANLCIAQILNSVSRRYVSYVGNPKLMNNVMEKIKISIPSSINEQTKIANFLSSVDSKIEEVGKQLDESKQFKKALLQKMFV
jgi:type I restriction enzyme S subunit